MSSQESEYLATELKKANEYIQYLMVQNSSLKSWNEHYKNTIPLGERVLIIQNLKMKRAIVKASEILIAEDIWDWQMEYEDLIDELKG
jgi:hypothetical protein